MSNFFKKQKGITLIALVITIIVLIILAGVSINAVMNDGLIGNAKEAKNEYDVAKEKEKIAITDLEVQTDFLKSGTSYLFRNGYLTGINFMEGLMTERVKSLEDKLPKGYYVYANGDTPTPIDNPDMTSVETGMILMKGETEESAQKIGTIIVFGDLNYDCGVGNSDARILDRYLKGIEGNLNVVETISADFNHDNVINQEDLNYYSSGEKIDQNVPAPSYEELVIEFDE